jgi:hypothetical protein
LDLEFLCGSERSLQYLNENDFISEEKDDPFRVDLKMFNTTPGDSLKEIDRFGIPFGQCVHDVSPPRAFTRSSCYRVISQAYGREVHKPSTQDKKKGRGFAGFPILS